MIEDALNAPFTRASIIGPAGTAQTSDIIDLGPIYAASAVRNIGRGEPLRLRVQVETSVTGGSTLTVNYMDSANPDGSNPTQRATFVDTTANPTSGYVLVDVYLPRNVQRYIFLQLIPTGSAATAGVVSAAILLQSDSMPGEYGWANQVLGY